MPNILRSKLIFHHHYNLLSLYNALAALNFSILIIWLKYSNSGSSFIPNHFPRTMFHISNMGVSIVSISRTLERNPALVGSRSSLQKRNFLVRSSTTRSSCPTFWSQPSNMLSEIWTNSNRNMRICLHMYSKMEIRTWKSPSNVTLYEHNRTVAQLPISAQP